MEQNVNRIDPALVGTPAVVLRDLVKDYNITKSGIGLLKSLLMPHYKGETYRALDHINATFNYGERIGLVGINGSGKSTLSGIISGIITPSDGQCQVNGTVGMLNTQVGLNPLLTGRESIHYKCLLMGFNEREIVKMEQDIIDFADIGIYLDQPLRTYSMGMKARLGFAISSQINPAVLVVDEGLSVGDASFARRCQDWMMAYSESGHCCLFVSHSMDTMREFCQKALWIHAGKQIAFGDAADILDAYEIFNNSLDNGLTKAEKQAVTPNYNMLMQQVEDMRIKART